jgi:hypothetical protein
MKTHSKKSELLTQLKQGMQAIFYLKNGGFIQNLRPVERFRAVARPKNSGGQSFFAFFRIISTKKTPVSDNLIA